MSSEPKPFKSKVDAWIIIVIILSILFPVVMGVFFSITDPKAGTSSLIAILLITILVTSLMIAIVFPIRYIVSGELITIRAGAMVKINVAIANIVEVVPTHNPISSPALSLDRIAIKAQVGDKSKLVIISPEDKNEFMRYLVSLDKGLVFDGSSVHRRSTGSSR